MVLDAVLADPLDKLEAEAVFADLLAVDTEEAVRSRSGRAEKCWGGGCRLVRGGGESFVLMLAFWWDADAACSGSSGAFGAWLPEEALGAGSLAVGDTSLC